ncbi:junctional adhesion molecule A-like [Engraulis encrasicolus]|uniref:junctional adhesion molecule A-like n=1 Tax=Engraulis encrasicolus TaxID=184585 RepID=UPI002FD20B8D
MVMMTTLRGPQSTTTRLLLLLLLGATGSWAFTATTSTPKVDVEENKGADLKCSPSADFGSDVRVEWKFQNTGAAQVSLVIYKGKPTEPYTGRVEQYNGGLRFSRVTRKDTGTYICAVAGNGYSAEAKIALTVLVPPSVPLCHIPASVRSGSNVKLTCTDKEASPPATYKWYKSKVPMPIDPSKFPNYKNMSYKLNPNNGVLVFPRVVLMDEGEYFCESTNSAGLPKRCVAARMAVYGVNTGGIVAGVIILLILIALLIVGLWFAHRKGYLTKMKERVSGGGPTNSAVYRPTSDNGDDEEGEFKQKSSFVV